MDYFKRQEAIEMLAKEINVTEEMAEEMLDKMVLEAKED